MGDRAQVAIKQPTEKDPDARVYLYAHWAGAGIYPRVQQALKDVPGRWNDTEYLTRAIARSMGMGEDGETGFGIGNQVHGDIEHSIIVLDPDTQSITFEDPEWEHNKNPVALPLKFTFAEYVALPDPVAVIEP